MEQWSEMGQRREDGRPERAARPAAEQIRRSTASPSDEGVGARPAVARGSPDHHTLSRRELRHALSSRQALRQAVLLHEILGMPKALQWSAGGTSHPLDGRPLPLNRRRQDHNGEIPGRPGSATRQGDPGSTMEGSVHAPEGSVHVPARPSSKTRRRVLVSPSIVRSVSRARDASANAIRRLLGRGSFGS